jgi:hypothetical protein
VGKFLHGSGRVSILAGSGVIRKQHRNNIDYNGQVDQNCLAIGSGSQSVGGELIVERWEWKRKEVETRSRCICTVASRSSQTLTATCSSTADKSQSKSMRQISRDKGHVLGGLRNYST